MGGREGGLSEPFLDLPLYLAIFSSTKETGMLKLISVQG